jgi:hypothetical protein
MPQLPKLPRLHGRLSAFGGKLALLVIALGLLAIGIGWNGAAGRGSQVAVTQSDGTKVYITDSRAQFPWLLSGGFLGLGLVVVGSALLVSQSHRADRSRLEAKLDEVVDALGTTRRSSSVPRDVSGLVAAGSTSYHRPDCRLVDGRDETELLTPAEANSRGLSACRICAPDAVEIQPR